jgi:DNA-directed RNA polymerase specialized sigma24 family protein
VRKNNILQISNGFMTTKLALTASITYTNEELRTLLRQGSEEVLFVLYDMYATALYSNILKLVNCTAKAEDILMQTFLQAHKKPISFEDCPFSLFIWLMRISLQLCLKEKNANGAMIVREDILTIFFPLRWPANKARRQEMLN